MASEALFNRDCFDLFAELLPSYRNRSKNTAAKKDQRAGFG
jgi:hypothetical protein